jgi:hydroxymethylglutaryl-CoA lyase
VPQLGDASEVIGSLWDRRESGRFAPRGKLPVFSALVPNKIGFEQLDLLWGEYDIDLVSKVSVFTAASETFNRKNTNVSIAESIERFKAVMGMIGRTHLPLRVRGYVSCAIACPFEGPIAPEKVADVVLQLIDIGVDEIDLGDTIGAGTPESIARLLDVLRACLPADDANWWDAERMTLHLHDTHGRAADCVRKALDLGIRSFDGSVAGLGGCPYASTPGNRAPGNISTETLVRTVNEAGYETGVDLDALSRAADFAREVVAKARMGAQS